MTQTQHQPMTLDEKLAICCKAAELKKAGDGEGASRLLRTVPIPSYMAKLVKDKLGLDFLLSLDRNLSEAEEEFGSTFFNN